MKKRIIKKMSFIGFFCLFAISINLMAKAKEIQVAEGQIQVSMKNYNEWVKCLADKYDICAVGYDVEFPLMNGNRSNYNDVVCEHFARPKMDVDLNFENNTVLEKREDVLELLKRSNISKSLLDLFYGMEKDLTGTYVSDMRLDTIPGLIHKENKRIWYIPSDSVRFEMSMGLYIDDSYPSSVVRNLLFKKLNDVIPEGFSYDIDGTQEILLKRGVKIEQSADSFIHDWEKLFNRVSAQNGYCSEFSNYPMIVGSRGCAVCHKIYEDSIWLTYIIEMSIDYHSSSGCTSFADYYTIKKSTGEVFTVADFLSQQKTYEIERIILNEFDISANSKGYSTGSITGKQLIERADGIAKLREGILFYYHPYKIGCGAEGQYNLI